MNTYTIYDSTGEIVSIFIGNESELSLNLQEGQNYIAGEYSKNEYKIINGNAVAKTDEEKLAPIDEVWTQLRDRRNIELSLSDWTQAVDAPLTDAKKQEWRDYRNALRSLPSNTTDPRNPTWPSKPT